MHVSPQNSIENATQQGHIILMIQMHPVLVLDQPFKIKS